MMRKMKKWFSGFLCLTLLLGLLPTAAWAAEDAETPLEDSLNLYAQAAEKIAACRTVLANAELRIEEIEQTMAQNAEGGQNEE